MLHDVRIISTCFRMVADVALFVEKTNLVLVFNGLSDDKKVKFRKQITEK